MPTLGNNDFHYCLVFYSYFPERDLDVPIYFLFCSDGDTSVMLGKRSTIALYSRPLNY